VSDDFLTYILFKEFSLEYSVREVRWDWYKMDLITLFVCANNTDKLGENLDSKNC